jgi:tetratricopeptide (TPR) repeat protein
MTHVTREELLRASEAGRAEVARVAAHLSVCRACRSLAESLLRDPANPGIREAPLRTLLELAAFEKEAAIEHLLARAEFAALRAQKRGAQKGRVIRSRACHTHAFLDVLLEALRVPQAREEMKFLGNLAVLAVQGMNAKEGAASKNDRLAAIWMEIGNARRMNGEWHHAQTALRRAEDHLATGTGKPALAARRISILASLRTDQGECGEAMVLLEECRGIHEARSDWPLVARTLVQMAHCAVDHDPESGLGFLDQARVFLPPEDGTLRWLAESNRTECLVNLGRIAEALQSFGEAERLRTLHHRWGADLRSAFTAGRLLEALGRVQEAEVLFEETVAGDLERRLYKDALLDLLYVFGFHVRQGRPERAAEISLHALAEMEREDSAVHEQLRSVWGQLIEAAQEQALDDGMLAEAAGYLQAHWKHPAPKAPAFGRKERALPLSGGPSAILEDGKLIGPLLARALWFRIRRGTRKEQQRQVAESPECRTRAFLDVLLAEVRTAGSRSESEFIASLALGTVEAMDVPTAMRHDLKSLVWTEIANVCRIDAEWSRALVALRRAEEQLTRGSGDLLLRGKMRSIAASLEADQGRRAEAVAILEECLKLYEQERAWALAARTLVQMSHSLVDTDPARGLSLVEKALPMIPASDAVLRWLAESNRTECLIELGEVGQALQSFSLAESLRARHPRQDAGRRSTFTAARLLEGLGRSKEAEQLFESAIADAFAHEAYREGFLDLLYLFGFHIRQDATEKAVSLCRFAIARIDLFEVGHEQLRTVWTELMEAAGHRAVSLQALAEMRSFLEMHWKQPAAKAPSFSFRPRGA